MTNPGEDPRRASLAAALDEAVTTLKRLRMDDPRRAQLTRRIVAIEDAIDTLGDDL